MFHVVDLYLSLAPDVAYEQSGVESQQYNRDRTHDQLYWIVLHSNLTRHRLVLDIE